MFNSDGLFSKANEAATKYNQAKEEEKDYLSSVMNELNNYNGIYEGETSAPTLTPTPTKQLSIEIQKETTKYTAYDGEWWIPKGFKETEDSAITIKGGKVIEDEAGNQFVWIPCYVEGGIGNSVLSATEYNRTNFGQNNRDFSLYNEELDSNDFNSIKKYGGFYIGRYEAGNDGANNVIIKKNQVPYGNVSPEDMQTKSTTFANAKNYDTEKVYTKIVSSYAWDTAINFILKTVNDYGVNPIQGNYSGVLKNTGLSTPVCNIYDMGGNSWEHTSESVAVETYCYSYRGGCGLDPMSIGPAAFRSEYDGKLHPAIGFRCSLYLK